MRSFTIRFALVGILGTLAACGGGGGDSGSGSDGIVDGSIEDKSGGGVDGGIVVKGESSTTLFSNAGGSFRLTGVNRRLPVRVLTPGYLSPNVWVSPGDTLRVSLEEDPDPEMAPRVSVDSVTRTSSGLRVRATATSPAGSPLVDVRAELLGTDDGVVLSRLAGGAFAGTVPTTASSKATVLVFAVDAQGRHGESMSVVAGEAEHRSYSGGPEHWVGSFFGSHRGGFHYGRYAFNASLAIDPEGLTAGLAAQVRLWRLEAGMDPLVTDSWTGTAQVLGKNYQVEVADSYGLISLTLMGTVSEDFGTYTGFAHGQIAGKPYEARFAFVNTYVLPNPWTAAALNRSWGLSFHYRDQATMSPPRYQYNVNLMVDEVGRVFEGMMTTLGPTTAAGATLGFTEIQGENLGYFTGSPGLVLSDETSYSLYAFMAVGTIRVHGVWSSSNPCFGTFWGRREAVWSNSDFDAQWQGEFYVTAGPDMGQVLNAQVRLDAEGQVMGGSIVAAPGGWLTGGNIALQYGSLSIMDHLVGSVIGNFQGDQEGVPVWVYMSDAPSPERASMGVYHARLIGKFRIETNGDTGYYFLYRNSNH